MNKNLANQPLKTVHLDIGTSEASMDATGKPVEGNDAKGAIVLNNYDTLNRPQLLWAKDHGTDSFSLRQITVYGDGPFADLTQQQAAAKNLLGQAYKTYDESGLIVANEFDFKGNLLEKSQKVLKDSLLQSTTAYTVDWPMPDDSNFDTLTADLLEHKAHENDTNTDGYITENTFDALNRVVKITLPKDVDDNRKEIQPTYNRAGALEKVTFDQNTYVNHVAYNAKGQRILLALGNGVMTRYTYDAKTFRLMRQRTETYSQDGWEYTPGGSVKQDTAYSYDLAGNIVETIENRTNAGFGTTLTGGQGPTPNELVREFDYDPLYRLIMATGREDTSHSHNLIWQDTSPVSPTPANSREYRRTYQYDKMGNILKLAHTAHQASFTRNFGYHTSMQHNKLEEVLDNSQNTLTDFLYDEAGNTIQNNSERFYIWDAANQLKQFKIDDGQTVSVYGQYLYSGGQRVKKLVKDQQGNYTITIYIDGVFEYQKLVKGASTYERNYTHIMDDRSRIATVRAGSDEDDITEDAFYVVEDHLNSSTARLKATDGGVIDREEYYPFGETSLHSFSKKRYRYTGKEKDSESGLYYYGARYYSAWCCRFVSIDPLAADYSHLSPYNYAGNKPINARDINGMNGENESKGASGGEGGNGTGNSGHSPMGGRGFLEPSGGTGQLDLTTEVNLPVDSTSSETGASVNHGIFITGDAAETATEQLQSRTNLTVSRNPDSGLISFTGEGKSKSDRLLLKISKDQSVRVDIITVKNSKTVNYKGMELPLRGGAYMGTEVNNQTKIELTNNKPYSTLQLEYSTVQTAQTVNPAVLRAFDSHVGKEGQSILYEIAQSYFTGVLSLRAGESDTANVREETPIGTLYYYKSKFYEKARDMARKHGAGQFIQFKTDDNGNTYLKGYGNVPDKSIDFETGTTKMK